MQLPGPQSGNSSSPFKGRTICFFALQLYAFDTAFSFLKKKIIYLAVWVLVVAYEIFHCVWIL